MPTTSKSYRQTTNLRLAAGLVSITCCVASVCMAGEGSDKKSDKPKVNSSQGDKSGDAVSTATLAAQLALEGENRKSPLLLLAAAELLGDLKESRQGVTAEKKSEDKGAATDKKPVALEYAALIDRARQLAGKDAKVQAVVDLYSSKGLTYQQGVAKETVIVEGQAYKVIDAGVIGAGETITLTNIVFNGDSPAALAIVGDGDGDLDLSVADGNTGGSIGLDDDTSSTCVVAWTPIYTGPFTARISNVGQIAERYVVLANWNY